MCVRASMKAAKPLHIVLATNPNPTRARGYPLNINPKPDPKPDSISGPAGSGRVADLYLGGPAVNVLYTDQKKQIKSRSSQNHDQYIALYVKIHDLLGLPLPC